MLLFRFRRLLFAALLLIAARAGALPSYITFPSDIDWVTRKSDHFEIVYRRGQDSFAERTIRAAEKAHALLAPIFPKGPDSTYIVLADFQDSTNGYSLDFPYPHFVIFAAPPEPTGTLSALDDWLFSVVLHEYVHTLHIYPANGLWSILRAIFGSEIVPNGLLPTHLHEGLATFLETELTTRGRGNGSHFKMYRRMAVEEGVWGTDFAPLDRFDGTVKDWPGGVSPYFFGFHLYQELWKRRGAKGIHDLTLSYSDNWPFYTNSPLEEVYGTDYPTLWKGLFDRTREETKREIAEIKRQGLTPLTYLTQSRYAKWDVAISPDGKRAAYRTSEPKEGTGLEIRDLRTREVVRRVSLGGGRVDGLCWGVAGRKEWILYLESSSSNNYSVNYLNAYSPADDRGLRLTTSGREPLNHLHNLACSPDLQKLVVYREVDGHGLVLELAWDGNEAKPLTAGRSWAVPTGAWVTSLSVGEPTYIGVRNGATSELFAWGAAQGQPARLLDMKAFFMGLKRALPSRDLFAIADIDGREEIWRIDPEARTAAKTVAVLGGITGYDQRDGRFLVSTYRHGGYDLAETPGDAGAAARPVAKRVARRGPRLVRLSAPQPERVTAPAPTGSPRRVATDPKLSEVRDYSAWPTLYPRSWIPQFLMVPNGAQFGVWIPGFDLAQKHSYNIMGGYDTRGLPFASLDYTYRFGLASTLDTGAYFLPNYIYSTGTFQKTWGGYVGVGTTIPGFPPRIALSAIFRRLEPFGNTPLEDSIGFGVTVSHSFGLKVRPLDISPIRGTKLSVSASQYLKSLGSSDDYWRLEAAADQYVHAPWLDGHVFYFGARGGFTDGTYLFNSNYQGGGELLFTQGKGAYLNRGFYYGTFYARRIVTLNVEYRFPLFRVDRGLSLNPVFLKQLHMALTADTTTYDQGPRNVDFHYKLFANYFYSAGVELKTDWTLFYYLPTQIRFGFYHGFGPVAQPFYYTIGVEAAL